MLAFIHDSRCLVRVARLGLIGGAMLGLLSGPAHAQQAPDDGWIIWASNRSGRHEIYRIRANATDEVSDNALQLTQEGGQFPAWSPDGQWIAYNRSAEGPAHLMRPDGSEDQQICSAPFRFWLHLSTGPLAGLICGQGDAFYRVNPYSGQRVVMFRKSHFTLLGDASFVPGGVTRDGRWLVAFSDYFQGGADATNGHFDGDDSAIVLDRSNRDQLLFFGYGSQPTTAPTGTTLYHVRGDSQHETAPDIYRIDVADLDQRETDPAVYRAVVENADGDWGHEYFPRVSNDNAWLVYAATTEVDGQTCDDQQSCDYEIFIHPLGSEPTSRKRVSFNEANDSWPDLYVGRAWQPGDPDQPWDGHWKINCGDGPAIDGWMDEDPFRTDGEAYTFDTSEQEPDLNQQLDPAPVDVYKTCIHREHSYSFPVPDGTYTVRLHFYDQGSGRSMTYTIEDQEVLKGFSSSVEVGPYKVLIEDFTVEVTDGDGLQIHADPADGNDAFESGIELIGEVPEPLPDPDASPGAPDAGPTSSSDASATDGDAGLTAGETTSSLGGGCAVASWSRAPFPLTGWPWLLAFAVVWLHRRNRRR